MFSRKNQSRLGLYAFGFGSYVGRKAKRTTIHASLAAICEGSHAHAAPPTFVRTIIVRHVCYSKYPGNATSAASIAQAFDTATAANTNITVSAGWRSEKVAALVCAGSNGLL